MDTPPPFSPPKRWPQFSLKSLMIAMTAVALLLGLTGRIWGLFELIVLSVASKGVAVVLAVAASSAKKPEHTIVLAAAAFGAWHPYNDELSRTFTSGTLYDLHFGTFLGFFLSIALAALFAGIAWQTLKFARNRGWSRF